jgi:hypothetical protein
MEILANPSSMDFVDVFELLDSEWNVGYFMNGAGSTTHQFF